MKTRKRDVKGTLNDKLLKLADEVRTCQNRINVFGKELTDLHANLNIISDWILAQFGVRLTDKRSILIKHMQENEEIEELTENISSLISKSCDTSRITTNEYSKKAISSNYKIPKYGLKKKMHNYGNDVQSNGVAISSAQENVHTDVAASVSEVSVPKRGRPRNEKQTPDLTGHDHLCISIACDICGKNLKDLSGLRQHKLIHKNLKPHACPDCGKCFRRKYHLTTHRLIHTGVKKHQCGYCGKLFLLPKDVSAHERTHTGEKPYSCNVCPKSFNLKSHLVMHLRVHTGEKPYKCDICCKCFTQSNTLRVHNKVHQKNRINTSPTMERSTVPVHNENEISPAIITYCNASQVSQQPSHSHHHNSSTIVDTNSTITTPPQSQRTLNLNVSSSAVNIPGASIVTFGMLQSTCSLPEHQHEENEDTMHGDLQGTSSVLYSSRVRDQQQDPEDHLPEVIHMGPEFSKSVEVAIMNLNHVSIEQIIGHENAGSRQNDEDENETEDHHSTQNFMGNNTNESYFY